MSSLNLFGLGFHLGGRTHLLDIFSEVLQEALRLALRLRLHHSQGRENSHQVRARLYRSKQQP